MQYQVAAYNLEDGEWTKRYQSIFWESGAGVQYIWYG